MKEKGATVRFLVFNLILGACVTILLTAPGIRFLGTHILGYPHDGFEYMWKMWWWHEALLEEQLSPSNMSYVNYPYDGSNPHLVASPLINALALPVVGRLGTLRTYNILMLLAFALSWPTAALLCYEFFHDPWAASLGGAVYAFYPNKVAHAVGGHLAQMFVFIFPLSVLFLYRAWKTPERRTNSLLAGMFVALSILVDLKHIALFIAPFIVLFLIFYGIVERCRWSRARAASMVVTFTVAALITVPVLAPLAMGRLSGQLEHFHAEGVVRHSADLSSFFVPPPEHPLYSSIKPLHDYSAKLAQEGWHENIFYLGLVTLLLTVFGTWKHWGNRDARFWSLVGIVGMILALGLLLKVGGKLVSLHVEEHVSYIPMPYYVLHSLPFYDWGRTPGRIIEMTMLALAVLAAGGAATLLGHVKSNYRSAAALGMIVVVLIDGLFIWPWPLGDAQVPEFYSQIAAEPQNYAILDLPLWEYRCERYQLYYATIHERPIVGGLVTRRSAEAEETIREVEQLVQPKERVSAAEPLAELGIRYVILHKLSLEDADLQEMTGHLTAQLGPPRYDDRWIRAFEVTGEPAIPPDWQEQ
ncbi:MAG: hypothetical protein U9R72_03485 [Chloroflexota bacterium]|nr:hypothetical protein [Chloroflexota bacterium]